jgi:hypothetical protein
VLSGPLSRLFVGFGFLKLILADQAGLEQGLLERLGHESHLSGGE